MLCGVLTNILLIFKGLGQTTLGAVGGLNFGSLLATSTAATTAPAPSIGLGGVDFSTSSENKSDTSSGTSALYVLTTSTTLGSLLQKYNSRYKCS